MRYLIPILALVALLAGTHTAHAWPCSERPNEAHCLTSTPLRHHKTPTPYVVTATFTPTEHVVTATFTPRVVTATFTPVVVTSTPTPEDTPTPLVPAPTCPPGMICLPDTGSGGYIRG